MAERIEGYYFEFAYHLFENKKVIEDFILFARYENFNTQDKMPADSVGDLKNHREEVTIGVSCFFTDNLVLKCDYQFKDDKTDVYVNNQFNLGIGWRS